MVKVTFTLDDETVDRLRTHRGTAAEAAEPGRAGSGCRIRRPRPAASASRSGGRCSRCSTAWCLRCLVGRCVRSTKSSLTFAARGGTAAAAPRPERDSPGHIGPDRRADRSATVGPEAARAHSPGRARGAVDAGPLRVAPRPSCSRGAARPGSTLSWAQAIPFGEREAALAADAYRKMRRPRGREIDLAIAACAVAHQAALWTLNRADFADIVGLNLIE